MSGQDGDGEGRVWRAIGAREPRYQGFLTVSRQRFELPDGRQSDWDILESVPSVVVLPLTADGQVVCVRQYRPGPGRVITSLPGGLLEPGESAVQAAHRELLEETGWMPGRVEVSGSSQWVKSTEVSWSAVAYDCRFDRAPRPDEFEDIAVCLFSPEEIRAGLREGWFGTVAQTYQALDHAGLL